ncbi:MAG: class I SAM-dependent methyltransferase [Actinomycetota bacterium]|nr:class I SAM-dependent methyltransferase [Actinomycetota bacterium]
MPEHDRATADWDTEGAVARVADLAGRGLVLELGVGTGRLVVPLAARGLEAHGLDPSADTRVPGTFTLVVAPFGTIFALRDQDAQVRCFANAAAHLGPGGRFVVEAWIPRMEEFASGSAVTVRALGDDLVCLDVARIDPVHQRMETTQVALRDGDVRLHPATHRYAWPAELDLMARLAGMEREMRHEDWRQTPFTAYSTTHVSVYRKR